MSKHPNEQVLTDGLLLEPHTTLQLVSVSPADVSQENFPTVLVGHVAGMPWEQQASRNVFSMVQINLGSQWSLLGAEQGKQSCPCTVAAAAVIWSMSSEKCSVLNEAEQDILSIFQSLLFWYCFISIFAEPVPHIF